MHHALATRFAPPVLLAAAAQLAGGAAAAASDCQADSAADRATIVELYTSEGCSSCPPADRWLSARAADPALVALAFHVDYWDRLGWKDRFGDAAYTDRQARQQRFDGARFVYTPQVVVDGQDRPDWSAAGSASTAAVRAPVAVHLEVEGGRARATVRALPGSPARLAGYWAVTEDRHRSLVTAGENGGTSLQHDRVVRLYRPIAAWEAARPTTLEIDLARWPVDRAHPRRVVLVVDDAVTGRPVQALQLGCG